MFAHCCNCPPTDINECVTQSPCHASAACTNTLGSFTCACYRGYSGDGTTCTGRSSSLFRSSLQIQLSTPHNTHKYILCLSSSSKSKLFPFHLTFHLYTWKSEYVYWHFCNVQTTEYVEYCCASLSIICTIFHLQMLMNVQDCHLVTPMLPAPTHSGPSHVLATRGTLEMD